MSETDMTDYAEQHMAVEISDREYERLRAAADQGDKAEIWRG